MPDVDKATRILNRVSSDEYSFLSNDEKKKIINSFLELPEENKPTSFRKCLFNDLEAYFKCLNTALKNKISNFYKKSINRLTQDGDDNRVGSDLVAYFTDGTRQRIELKFGSETNANIGNNTMNSVFGVADQKVSFTSLCSDLRLSQYDFVITKSNGECDASWDNLDNLVDKLTEKIQYLYDEGIIKPDSAQIKRMLESSGSLENYDLIGANQMKIFIKYKKVVADSLSVAEKLDLSGNWEITSIKKAENAIRTEIRVANNSCYAKFLLNWKNNYKHDGSSYSAKLGVGSSSWNVWLYKN